MAKAKRLPSGQWRTLVYDYTEVLPDGKKKRHYESFTADTKKESEYLAAEFTLNKKQKRKSVKNIPFIDALEEYISLKQNVLSPSTIRGYNNIKSMLKKDFTWFCSIPVNKIEQNDIQSLINELTKKKSPKTCRNYHGLISAVLNETGINFSLNTTMPQKIQPQLYIPTDKEIESLLKAVKGTELEIPIMLGAFCTMRRGEICGLSIDDLSDDNILHIHHSLVQGPDMKLHLKAPKTVSSDRYVQIPDFVAEQIRERGYITKIKPNTITKRLSIIQKKNGLPKFRFHDLRHYSASVQHALGIPDAYIMQRGGWSSDKVLKDVYRHAMNDRQKEMNDIANKHFENIMQHEMQHEKEKA